MIPLRDYVPVEIDNTLIFPSSSLALAPPGKNSNPPRYWKTKVFPAALTFIASTVGKTPPQQDAPPAATPAEAMQAPVSCAPSGLAAEAVVPSSPARKSSHSGSNDGNRTTAEPAVSPPSACNTSVSSSALAQNGARNKEEAARGTERRSHEEEEEALGEETARQPEPPRSFEQPPSASAAASTGGRVEISSARSTSPQHPRPCSPSREASTRPASPPQRRHPQPGALSKGGAAGKCLVACPTGAEASVVVCLSALAAFFPAPPGSTSDGGTPAAREGRLRLRSPRQTSASAENRAAAENRSTPEKRATLDNHATTAAVAGKCDTETDKEEPGLQQERDGFAVLRRGAGVVTKPQLRWRFLLLQQECPWARPPRRLMQELNEYFMSPGEHSWWSLSDHLLLAGGSDREAGAHTQTTEVVDCPGVSADRSEASVDCLRIYVDCPRASEIVQGPP